MADAFLLRCEPGPGTGPRLAVKDLIDVAGLPTSAGCRAVAETAGPARVDAACVAAMRAAGARVVGKTALNELAAGANGVNPWYGTPANPCDPALVPGGSSSGSAVAVALGEADLALGTDTGGSVRVPAACCAVSGLKTTVARIPLTGVTPLAPSLDSVGPLARDVAGLVLAMAMLERGFRPAAAPADAVARLRGLGEDPALGAALDAALELAGLASVDVRLPGWAAAREANRATILSEGALVHARLLRQHPAGVSAPLHAAFAEGAALSPQARVELAHRRAAWVAEVGAVLARHRVLALPGLLSAPPALGPPATPGSSLGAACSPVNLAGLPAVVLPVRWPPGVPPTSRVPASLQLVAAAGGEELLLATAARVEQAAGAPRP